MRADAAAVLISMGYRLDTDFVASDRAQGIEIEWRSGQPMPSEADIEAYDMSPSAVAAREDAKEPLLADLKEKAQAAIDANQTFLALPSPLTPLDMETQLRRLTRNDIRELKALARLVTRTWR